MGNPFVHIELTTSDVPASRSFYNGIFDWKFTEIPEMKYHLVDTGTPPGGGIMEIPEPGVPVAWTVYVTVADVSAVVKQACNLGGELLKEKTEVPGMGWFAILRDPQGGVFGIWEGT